MARMKSGLGAEKAGYLVFKLGAAGTLVGLATGTVIAGGTHAWMPMERWMSYSLAVTVAGALIGSATGLARTRQAGLAKDDDVVFPDARAIQKPVSDAARRVSAFRHVAKSEASDFYG